MSIRLDIYNYIKWKTSPFGLSRSDELSWVVSSLNLTLFCLSSVCLLFCFVGVDDMMGEKFVSSFIDDDMIVVTLSSLFLMSWVDLVTVFILVLMLPSSRSGGEYSFSDFLCVEGFVKGYTGWSVWTLSNCPGM